MEVGRRLVRPVGAQGAGMVHALAAANAWMVVPAEVEHLPAGAPVEVWPMWGRVPAHGPPDDPGNQIAGTGM